MQYDEKYFVEMEDKYDKHVDLHGAGGGKPVKLSKEILPYK